MRWEKKTVSSKLMLSETDVRVIDELRAAKKMSSRAAVLRYCLYKIGVAEGLISDELD